MKRLTKEQIEEIKRLREEGKKVKEIAEQFKVYPNTIRYHTEPEFKKMLLQYNKQRYGKMTKEEREKYFIKKRDYQKNYQNKRYKNDPKFREKHLERAREYQRKRYKKKQEKEQ